MSKMIWEFSNEEMDKLMEDVGKQVQLEKNQLKVKIDFTCKHCKKTIHIQSKTYDFDACEKKPETCYWAKK